MLDSGMHSFWPRSENTYLVLCMARRLWALSFIVHISDIDKLLLSPARRGRGILVAPGFCPAVGVPRHIFLWVFFCKFYSHSDPIFKKLEILTIDDIHFLQQIQFYYKYLNHLLPNFFTNFNFATNATVHNYSTRGCHQIRNSLVKHDFSRKCIRYSPPILMNTTPIIILDKITSHSIKGFTTYIKRSCIDKYTVLCQLANCYTCEQARTWVTFRVIAYLFLTHCSISTIFCFAVFFRFIMPL